MKWLALLVPLLFTLPASARFFERILIDTGQYKRLSPQQRKAYVRNVRAEFSRFEQERLKSKPVSFFQLVLDSAFAENETCLMGGREQPVIGGKCSSRNNECPDQPDSFKCGSLYNESCIPRTPVNSISKRCRLAAEETETNLTPEQFQKFALEAQALYAKHCPEGQASNAACLSFRRRMNALNIQPGSELPPETTTEPTQPSAPLPGQGTDAQPAPSEAPATAPPPASASTSPPAAPTPAVSPATAPAPVPAPASPSSQQPVGPCYEKADFKMACLNDSLTVRNNPDFLLPKCKDKSVACGELEIATCESAGYKPGVSGRALAETLRTIPEFAALAEKVGLTHETLMDEVSKGVAWQYPQATGNDAALMKTVVEKYNRNKGHCQKFADRAQIVYHKERCGLQMQKLETKNLTLEEVNQLGESNQSQWPQFVKKCGEPKQENKETGAQAVRISFAAPNEGCPLCKGTTLTFIPLRFVSKGNQLGVIEGVDAFGKELKLEIHQASTGAKELKLPPENKVSRAITSISQVAACQVTVNGTDVRKLHECSALKAYHQTHPNNSAVPHKAAAPVGGTP